MKGLDVISRLSTELEIWLATYCKTFEESARTIHVYLINAFIKEARYKVIVSKSSGNSRGFDFINRRINLTFYFAMEN